MSWGPLIVLPTNVSLTGARYPRSSASSGKTPGPTRPWCRGPAWPARPAPVAFAYDFEHAADARTSASRTVEVTERAMCIGRSSLLDKKPRRRTRLAVRPSARRGHRVFAVRDDAERG